MKTTIYGLISLLLIFTGCQSFDNTKNLSVAPIAKKIPKELTIHDDTRIDNYFWMRLSDEQKKAETPDAQTQDVLDYLNAENEYLDKTMEHTNALQEKLYEEIIGRIKKDDISVPVNDNGYSYYTRFEEGDDYALYCRKKLTEGAKEEIMLNGPEMAEGYSYFGMGSRSVSLDNKFLAFGLDTISRRQYTIYFKNLETGEMLKDKLSNTGGSAVWANDNRTVFYTTKDPQTLRQNKIVKHIIGTDQSKDEVVYEETDDTFRCFVYKTKSDAFLMIASSQTLSSEFRFLDANTPNGEWKIIQNRKDNLEYSVDHYNDNFYIRTNLDAPNFKLVKTPINKTTIENWTDVLPHRDNVFFQGFDLFKNYLVVQERKDGLRAVRVKIWDDSDDHYIKFNDPAYVSYTTSNLDFDTDILRYGYTSLTTPNSVFDYNMKTKEQVLLKQTEVLDDKFSPENYISERIFATADDGTQVPVSMVYRKDLDITKTNPLLLYAYGSYGSSQEPAFSSSRLSLLNRGFVYAIAHIRGGQEMGRHWYENGKLLKNKKI